MPVHRVPIHGQLRVGIDKSFKEEVEANLLQARCDRTTISEAINTTIPKMLNAQSTISQ